ncbi:MAG: MFS transporter [Neisseriaceae bacterium]|nr:MFS transporter [Neisseriaceae bacterium]
MTTPTASRLTFLCLLLTVFLDQVGISLILPIIPSLLADITHHSLVDNAVIGGWLIAVYGLMQFIFAPIMGAVSDRFGRKVVLIICFIAFAVDYLLYAIADTLTLLFLARMIAGIAGSSIVVSLAGIADISQADNKTKHYAYIFATMSLGVILGPTIASFTIQYGIRTPFYIAGLLSVLSLLAIVLFFKETLPSHNRRPFAVQSPLKAFLYFNKYKGMMNLLIVQLLFVLAAQVPVTLWAFFTKYRFDWSDGDVAKSFIALGIIGFFVQIYLVKKLYPVLGNKKIAYLGFGAFGLGLLLIALSSHSWQFYLALCLYGLAGISNAAITSIYSSKVSASEQGQLMGIIESISSMCVVVGPIMAVYLFRFSVALETPLSDGYPFMLAAILVAICLYLLKRSIADDEQPTGQGS